MLWILLTLLSATCICVAQNNGNNCQCVAYFYCQKTCSSEDCSPSSPVDWKNGEEDTCGCNCTDLYDVCCDINSIATATQNPKVNPPTPTALIPRPVDDEENCGRRNTIIDWKVCCNDEDAKFGEFPWMVAIMKVDPSGSQEFLCGGSIIDPFVVITTAHTLKGLGADRLLVKAGVWNTTDPNEVTKHQDRSVARVLLHAGFSQAKVANDFALLFLGERLSLNNENVAPVCRPSRGLNIDRSTCIATGWGADSFGNHNLQSILKKVELPLIDPMTCQDALRKTKLGSTFDLHSSFMCAGRENADTCKGDGGGPLMCPTLEDKNRYVQVGITSWGIGCNNGVPGVYSNVQQVSNWIETEITNFRSGLKE